MEITNKRAVILIMSLCIMLIIFTIAMSYLVISRNQIDVSTRQKDMLIALYTAEAGIEHAIAEMIADPSAGDNVTGSLNNVNYTVTRVGDELTSESIKDNAKRKIKVEVKLPVPYAIQAGDGIEVGSDNDSFTLSGGKISSNSYNDPNEKVPLRLRKPAFRRPIRTPKYDVYIYKSVIRQDARDIFTISPEKSISSTIMYVTGNVKISGNVNLDNVTIIAEGDIRIEPGGANNTVNITNNENYPALISKKKILIGNETGYGGNVDISGVIYSGGDNQNEDTNRANSAIEIRNLNSLKIKGALIAKGKIKFKKNDNINIELDPNLQLPSFSDSGEGGFYKTISLWEKTD